MAAKNFKWLVLFYSLSKFLFFCQLWLIFGIGNVNSSGEVSTSEIFSSSSTQVGENINNSEEGSHDHVENTVNVVDPGQPGVDIDEETVVGNTAELTDQKTSSNSLDQLAENTKQKEESFTNITANEKDLQTSSSNLNHLTELPKAENSTAEENSNGNTTNKTTEPLWKCKKYNLTKNSVVVLGDKNSLIRWLDEINKTMSCAVVLFYAKWCFFSARLAPIFNAAGRAFSDIPFLAFDAYTYNSLNTRYGIVGVPTIILFQENKPVARFNRTRTFKDLVEFIHKSTGMEYNTSVELSPEDYDGPLPSTPSEDLNYHLVASLLFLVCIGLFCLWRLQYIQMLWQYCPSWSLTRRIFWSPEREKSE